MFYHKYSIHLFSNFKKCVCCSDELLVCVSASSWEQIFLIKTTAWKFTCKCLSHLPLHTILKIILKSRLIVQLWKVIIHAELSSCSFTLYRTDAIKDFASWSLWLYVSLLVFPDTSFIIAMMISLLLICKCE